MPSDSPPTVLSRLLAFLAEGKDAAIRRRKAGLQREFMITRRQVDDTYADYSPEELPVDISRLHRDLVHTRDRQVDEAAGEVDDAFAVACRVLETVAAQYPQVYLTALEDVGLRGKPWAHDGQAAPMPRKPRTKRKELTTAVKQAVVKKIRSERRGVILFWLTRDLGLDVDGVRQSVVRFIRGLREQGHVQIVGVGKGARYQACASLRKYEKGLTS